ncbi:DEAD/DEAH box helicase family protein [Siphonobacter sp. SORGH_AS_0500]|uniref:type I restriction endonuclease subunit R n=1 Tax=Siphonobacter sp. SORGH_AS_0500 TaxID=1864824 RepID=UPI0028659BAE|nr:DEAD/DEAH box helicase family protein [Siphonobacter sp. SORGH_AS_0500]MDR6194059.1 type I restriction enzyme R subunit [Siphonobacter sp. SORGH_AS_0500]
MAFNEDSRVKIPAILHLCRMGYTYIPKRQQNRLEENNIFPEIFKKSIAAINDISEHEAEVELQELSIKLHSDDLGRDFYRRLVSTSGKKLIDFQNFHRNTFHVTTELTYKNGDEEFRPDITLLINGMPLVFIEVKKPNNREGVLAERSRINTRFALKEFTTFTNITQLMLFSNNMEYEDGVTDPVMGAYYGTPSKTGVLFNYFREEEILNLTHLLKPEDTELENLVLKDNNIVAIKHTDEFKTNKHFDTPTNRLLTSLLSGERLAFFLQFGIAYVEDDKDGKLELQKHIMRYPQLFATKALAQKLDGGTKQGIIWHTQGSGKTALAFFNVKFLTDYFQKKNTIPKFYFIVDRLDLANQAKNEFRSRGLSVRLVNSREEFIRDMKRVGAVQNHSGEMEISVVNIQKFTEDTKVLEELDYDLNIQRVYFIDEAHRSYNPKGSYLVNLLKSDTKSIRIALTGTPLLKEVAKDYDSKALFGNYIHTYYYNRSIADGYTLRLIREGIDTTYKMQMKDVIQQINILQGEISKSEIFAHPRFVEPMLEYIVNDLKTFRKTNNDYTLGGMVVCDSADQAKELFAQFEGRQRSEASSLPMAAEGIEVYASKHDLKASLILHDVNSKDDREKDIKAFKRGEIDLLFVYNMLLTGFDAKRLKKLYLARVVKNHNLLQTLTRVNRPYKNYRFGYVVDFADITKEFRLTNQNYFEELQGELGDEFQNYSNLFKSPEEITSDIEGIQEKLFDFDTHNAEKFRLQIDEIRDKKQLLELQKVLTQAKELRNIIRLQGQDELLKLLDFNKLNQLLAEVQRRLDILNLVDDLNQHEETSNLLNLALEDIFFQFTKVSEEEMILADRLRNQLRKTREELQRNFDPKDPAFISLKEELERIFRNKNLDEVSQEDMRENIGLLNRIYDEVKELNRQNALLKAKYDEDEKYARVHKRLMTDYKISAPKMQVYDALMSTKAQVDGIFLNNINLLQNDAYFRDEVMSIVIDQFIDTKKIDLDYNTTESINHLIVKEYLHQYK